MNIIGALKKSNTPSTVYFCEYSDEDFPWGSVSELLKRCPALSAEEAQSVKKEDIYCIAVECDDGEPQRTPVPPDFEKGVLVGIVFDIGEYFVSYTAEEHADLELYLNELTESNESKKDTGETL